MTYRKAGFLIAVVVIFTVLIFANTDVADAASKQYPSLYKSPRVMGMGGANVAIGGKFDSVFYNPAGLGKMPEENWEVNVLGLSTEVGQNVTDFGNDMLDAFDVGDEDDDGEEDDDQLSAVVDVLADYRGDFLHFGLSNLSSAAKNSDNLAFGLGGLATANMDAIPHQGLGEEGFLEVHANARYGGLGGVAYRVSDNLYVGAALKLLHTEAIDNDFSAREIVENEDDLGDYFTDELRQSGDAVGVDAGLIYEFKRESRWRPAVGCSIQNIGDMDFGDAGEIPMTVNIGASINPEVPFFKSAVVGLDYVDLFNNHEQDSDIGKRVRLGGELGILDSKVTTITARAGLYQGYPTFGADIRLFVVTLNYTTYAEEVGAYAGQDDDRRHLVALNLGW